LRFLNLLRQVSTCALGLKVCFAVHVCTCVLCACVCACIPVKDKTCGTHFGVDSMLSAVPQLLQVVLELPRVFSCMVVFALLCTLIVR